MKRIYQIMGAMLISCSAQVVSEPLRLESGEKQIPLIELYTSQGCYSCPPAEKWLNRLSSADGLWQQFVPLALHVDYWDYLGWEDPFADKRNVARQYKYRSQSLVRAVYTPQVVVDGRDTRRWPVLGASSFKPGMSAGNLVVNVEDNAASIRFTPSEKQEQSLRVHLAVLGFDIKTAVPSGENKGRTLAQEFIVLNQANAVASTSNGNYEWQLDIPAVEHDGRLALAAWVDHPKNNTPLQATGGWYQPPQ